MAAPDLEVRDRPCGGLLQGDLPTGCGMCTKGAKLVLFVTGVCHYDCFYCPISDARRMDRGAWANERYVPPEIADDPEGLAAIAEEVRATRARGTGLTGGDPMYAPERTVRYIRFLKEEFGEGHHVHIYTQIPFDERWLPKLHDAGLDEFRFHPPEEIWHDVDAHEAYASLYRAAQGFDWDVGFEIPCIPGWGEETMELVRWLDAGGFPFLNLNEFEFSETNVANLRARGHDLADDVTNKAHGSADLAREVIKQARGEDLEVAVHFCSSPFKDAIQLRARLRRRAEHVARDHELVTEDGTILRGVLDVADEDPHEVAARICDAWDVPPELLHVRERADIGPRSMNPRERAAPAPPVDGKGTERGPALGGLATTGREVPLPAVVRETRGQAPRDRLEVAPWVLEEIAGELPWPAYHSEVYPTDDELEVERAPLNAAARGEAPGT